MSQLLAGNAWTVAIKRMPCTLTRWQVQFTTVRGQQVQADAALAEALFGRTSVFVGSIRGMLRGWCPLGPADPTLLNREEPDRANSNVLVVTAQSIHRHLFALHTSGVTGQWNHTDFTPVKAKMHSLS